MADQPYVAREKPGEIREGTKLHGEKLLDAGQRFKNLLGFWLPRWVRHASENWNPIRYEFRTKNVCLTSLPKLNCPAIVVGSGPTLDESVSFLKHWKYPIFCSASNAKIVLKHGRMPDFVCAYDANDKYPVQQLQGVNWKGATMLTHPCVSPNTLNLWRWKKLYYRMLQPGINYFDEILLMQYPWIKVGFLNSGSTGNNATEIANFLGCNPIIFLGLDYSYPNYYNRATGWDYIRKAKRVHEWVLSTEPQKIPEDSTHWNNRRLHKTDSGWFTNEEMIDYKIGFFVIVRLDQFQPLICVGDSGTVGSITEFPTIHIQEVIEAQESGFEKWMHEKSELAKIAEEYLKKHNIRRRKTVDGKMVIGYQKPENVTKDGKTKQYVDLHGKLHDTETGEVKQVQDVEEDMLAQQAKDLGFKTKEEFEDAPEEKEK